MKKVILSKQVVYVLLNPVLRKTLTATITRTKLERRRRKQRDFRNKIQDFAKLSQAKPQLQLS